MAENVIANYEGYRAQVRSLVDEYVHEIDKGPNYVKPKKERHRDELVSFFLKELDAEKVMFYKADPFVDSLRFSKKPSTSKLGSL